VFASFKGYGYFSDGNVCFITFQSLSDVFLFSLSNLLFNRSSKYSKNYGVVLSPVSPYYFVHKCTGEVHVHLIILNT